MALDASLIQSTFSAKEVSVAGDVTHLTVSVPVPEDFRVKFLDADLEIREENSRFLPPITVSLSSRDHAACEFARVSAHPDDVVANIHCVWIPLNKQRFIGEILVQEWAKGADPMDKIEHILESGWLISDKVLGWQPDGKLDLLWRTPKGPIGWHEERPRPCRQKSGRGLFYTSSASLPKNYNVMPLMRLVAYRMQEGGAVVGKRTVLCCAAASCLDLNQRVSCLRVVTLRGCTGPDGPHYVCLRCANGMILAAPQKAFACPMFRCAGGLDVEDAKELIHDPKVQDRMVEAAHHRELSTAIGDQFDFVCPNEECGKKNGSNHYLKTNGITHCWRCLRCWCERCERWRKRMEDGPDPSQKEPTEWNQDCDFSIGQAYARGDEECREQILQTWGPFKLNFVIREYNRQCHLVDECRGCPGCSVTVMKTGGCSKMTCASCDIYFCWCCGSIIPDRSDPYIHYRQNPSCRLNPEEI